MAEAAELGTAFWQRAARRKRWGLLALRVAAGLWVWLVYLLTVPYSANDAHQCAALLFRDMIPSAQCLQPRPWWEMLGLLGAALPLSVVGVGLYVAGSVSQSLWYHLRMVRYFEGQDSA